MTHNKLVIQINKPVARVFAFVLDPQNTPKWLEHITTEETNEWPVKVGTIYRNQNREGQWTEYAVTALKHNNMFIFSRKDGTYQVRYVFRPTLGNGTKLEYVEWVEEGELEAPFALKELTKLKEIIES